MDLSIIIVNWNTKDLLIRCLDSLLTQGYKGEHEIWVVDNASSDGSTEIIRNYSPNVNLIAIDENVGFGAANNLAIRQSKGKYIWLLNPDTEVKPGAITALTQFMDENSSTGAAGSKYLNPDGSLQASCYPFPTLSREFWRLFHLDKLWTFGIYNQNQWNQNEPREVDVLQGASLLLRKKSLDQIGLFDEDYFMYTEEVDLCYRLKKAGWQLFWVPKSEVIHYGGQSTQQAASNMFISLYKTKLIFFNKHYSWFDFQVYKFVLTTASILRLMITPLAWLEPHSTRVNRFALAKNYQRLIVELWKI